MYEIKWFIKKNDEIYDFKSPMTQRKSMRFWHFSNQT